MLTSMIINTLEGFEQLKNDWDGLLTESDNNEIFLTYDWLLNWWKIFKSNNKYLKIVAIRDSDKLIAIAPLYIEHDVFKVLKFMSSGYPLYPDYLDFIIRKGYEEEAVKTILTIISSLEWDCLCLSDIRKDSINLQYIRSFGESILGKIYEKPSARCRFIKLPGSPEEYVKRLSKNRRGKIANSINRLKNKYASVEYGQWPANDVKNGLEELGRLHRKRWAQKRVKHSFSKMDYLRFHEHFVDQASKKGRANIKYLKLNNEIVALIYLLCYQDKVYYYQSGFDPDYHRFSPGLVLLNEVIKEAIINKAQEFDFLRGEHKYKNNWADLERELVTALVFRKNMPGRLAYLRKYLLPAIKSKIARKIYT